MMIDNDIERDYGLERNRASLKLVIGKLCDEGFPRHAKKIVKIGNLASSSPTSIYASSSSGAGTLPGSLTRPRGSPERCERLKSRAIYGTDSTEMTMAIDEDEDCDERR